jgi:hypothetical protein
VACQQLVDGLVGGQERQALQQAEARLGQGPRGTQSGDAQGGFVNQLHRETRLNPLR